MKAKDCMCNDVTCVKSNASIYDVAKIMNDNHVGCVPVCNDENSVCGIVTDRDIILRSVACDKDIKTSPVSDIMTCNVYCCTPDTDVSDAEHLMSQNQVRRIPVIDNNKIVGILTLGDLATTRDTDVDKTLENICKCDDKNAE